MDSVGEGEGGKSWENGIETYNIMMVVESGLNAMKKDARGLSRVAAGNPGFPRLVPVTSGSFSSQGASEKSGILWSWERPLGTPLGLLQWKRA